MGYHVSILMSVILIMVVVAKCVLIKLDHITVSATMGTHLMMIELDVHVS